ncbi:MAG: membrane protein insertase YidC [Candidatus Omnitrophica bacterium]|nr:membrane protein insertase YidC [Candidatus Omnitrophota bacterium]HOX54919.1 membrane protein insertase YidC [Candidatus Omnitrophota bacterium]
MEKRVVIAVVLSVLILLGYQVVMTKMYPNASQTVTQKVPAPVAIPSPSQEKPSISIAASQEELFTKETGKYILTFSNIGGKIKEVMIKDYAKTLLERDLGIVTGFENAVFKLSQRGNSVVYTYQDQNLQLIKIFNFSEEKYIIDMEIIFNNISTQTNGLSYRIYNSTLDLERYTKDELVARDKYFLEFSISLPDKIIRKNFQAALKGEQTFFEKATWVGVRDRYFCSMLFPLSPISKVFIKPIGRQSVTTGIETVALDIPPATKYTFYCSYYIGPQDLKLLSDAHAGSENIVSFGTFDIISQSLLYAMRFLDGYLHSWGICVLLISFLVFLVLYPLTAKSLSSMKKMQELQPQIERLREQFKDQPQKLNKEIMDLYKGHKINPFGGCLPMFLQIPVFFGLYQALMRSVELKGAKFLWIKDLSEPDRLITLNNSLPLIGKDINILPIIMIIGMFFQQKMSMKSSTSSTMQEQQKIMMFAFPLLFGYLFYHFPSGLTLYWVSYTILSLLAQRLATRAERK